MSKTIVAIDHDNPAFVENGPHAHATSDIRVHNTDVPDAENNQLVSPDQGFCSTILVNERRDNAWINVRDPGMS